MTTTTKPWADKRDALHPIRVEFAGGDADSWITVEGALDRIDPIDRDAARVALLDGAKFRTFGAWYSVDPEATHV